MRGTGAPLRYPAIRGSTLGGAADTGFRARAHPTGRTRRVGHICSPSCSGPGREGPAVLCVLHSGSGSSDTHFELAAGNVLCSARRCAVKLNFWHSPGYVCKYPGRTIQPCFVGGMATCSCQFHPALPAHALSRSRRCPAQSTQMCCALHTSAQTAQYDCRGTL